MCVRYTLHKSDAALGAISKALGEPLEASAGAPTYNVTLTSIMPVVARFSGKTAVRPMRWGLIGAAAGAAPQRLLANARAETARTLPAFRQAVASRRCLVPANGFYEWEEKRGVKLPHLFTLRGEEPFAFAGIWDPALADIPETYCILTTTPNAVVGLVHDRMPVILTSGAMGRWLGEQPLEEDQFRALVQPLDPSLMESRRVSRFVSNSRNQGPECLAPPDEPPPEPEFNFG